MNRRFTLGREDLVGVFVTVVLVNLVGGAPAALGGPGTEWFQSLTKPAIYPPPWLFGVVWTTLFSLLGVALYIVWQSAAPDRQLGLALFVVQMGCNVAWTPAFFGAQNLTLALGIIVALLVVAVPMAVAFWRIDRTAGLLVVPYLLWVGFAAVLNYQFIALN